MIVGVLFSQETKLCVPCSNDDTEVKATHFCQTCKDPEPLCETCAKHHTRQKLTKGHKMCADMAYFPTSETNHGYLFVLSNQLVLLFTFGLIETLAKLFKLCQLLI